MFEECVARICRECIPTSVGSLQCGVCSCRLYTILHISLLAMAVNMNAGSPGSGPAAQPES